MIISQYKYQKNNETQTAINTNREVMNTDSIILFFVALAPILQHYRGIVVNPSLGITYLFAIIALFRLFSHKICINIGFLFLFIYSLYASFIHGINFTYLMREMSQVAVFLAVINGLFDIKKLLKYCRYIAVTATALIILQYFCFYILGFHLQLVAIPLLNPSNEQWFGLIRTGMIGVTGKRLAFYRPSAFFLEPSHFAIFCIPVITTTLFSRTGDEKRERMIALFISLGVLLSTSGMGIGALVFCWGTYLGFFYGQKGKARTIHLRNLLNTRSIFLIVAMLILLIVLYLGVPFVRQSVQRIFFAGGNSSLTAIEGRTITGRRSLTMLQGMRNLIGFGDIYDISNWNMAAFFFVTFRFGWIGTVLFYSFYVYSAFKIRREAQMMTIIFLMLSFFTVHMFGAYYKMYYTMIILNGYVQLRQERLSLLATT